jgi:hypothetical protein
MSESEMTRSVSSIAAYLSLEELMNCLGRGDTRDTTDISATPSPTKFKLLVHTLDTVTLKNRLRSVSFLLLKDLLTRYPIAPSSRNAVDPSSDLPSLWAGQLLDSPHAPPRYPPSPCSHLWQET